MDNFHAGYAIARHLIERIRNSNEPPVTIQIPGELVIREST